MPYPDIRVIEPDRAERRRAVTRRQLLAGGVVAALGLLGGLRAARSASSPGPGSLTSTGTEAFGIVPNERPGPRLLTATLQARRTEVDLGGRVVRTWAYGDAVPGPVLRGRVGDTLAVRLDNQLPEDTTVHWHGLAIPNDMDGVPDLTQTAVATGDSATYRFALPHPGTYWYHPHVGVQADRGLYGALIVEDPAEPGRYDLELLVVLDDWLDGTGRSPDDVMRDMQGGMGAMQMGSRPRSAALGSEGGDVSYPHYLLNGRLPSAPVTFRARPGQRARIRIVNAGADTAFRVALGGHRLTVTHSDGFPVRPVTVDTLLVAMGERYDLDVRLGDGAFPLVAAAEGKQGQARAVVRTASGPTPPARQLPEELGGRLLRLRDLHAAAAVLLPRRAPERSHDLVFEGDMMGSGWTINGHSYDPARALPLGHGEVTRLRFVNLSSMFHPVHVHGHTFQVRLDGGAGTGPRKDTVLVVPLQTVVADLVADNPGRWLAHCHNLYHSMSGMMALLAYR